MCRVFQQWMFSASPSRHVHMTFAQWCERLGVNIEPVMYFHLYVQVNLYPVLKKEESVLYYVLQPELSKSCGRNISKMEIAKAQPLVVGGGDWFYLLFVLALGI